MSFLRFVGQKQSLAIPTSARTHEYVPAAALAPPKTNWTKAITEGAAKTVPQTLPLWSGLVPNRLGGPLLDAVGLVTNPDQYAGGANAISTGLWKRPLASAAGLFDPQKAPATAKTRMGRPVAQALNQANRVLSSKFPRLAQSAPGVANFANSPGGVANLLSYLGTTSAGKAPVAKQLLGVGKWLTGAPEAPLAAGEMSVGATAPLAAYGSYVASDLPVAAYNAAQGNTNLREITNQQLNRGQQGVVGQAQNVAENLVQPGNALLNMFSDDGKWSPGMLAGPVAGTAGNLVANNIAGGYRTMSMPENVRRSIENTLGQDEARFADQQGLLRAQLGELPEQLKSRAATPTEAAGAQLASTAGNPINLAAHLTSPWLGAAGSVYDLLQGKGQVSDLSQLGASPTTTAALPALRAWVRQHNNRQQVGSLENQIAQRQDAIGKLEQQIAAVRAKRQDLRQSLLSRVLGNLSNTFNPAQQAQY